MKMIILAALALALVGCGGGSGGSSSAASNITELEGKWVYSTASHITGGDCGLDVHGGFESRTTITFSGSNVTESIESCAIIQGNTGGFVLTNSATGPFTIGVVYLTFGGESYKELNITANGATHYSGYFLNGNQLKIAQPTVGNDGSTPAKRYNGVGLYGQPVLLKQ